MKNTNNHHHPTSGHGGSTEPAIEIGRNRLLVMCALFCVVFFVITVRLIDVTTITTP